MSDLGDRMFAIPLGIAQRKPPHGAACNRCGVCCIGALCPLAAHVFKRPKTPGPCPALEWEEASDGAPLARCGLVAHPANYAPERAIAVGGSVLADAAKWLIGALTGCDARINGEPINFPFYRVLEKWDRDNAAAVRRAKRMWRMP